MSDFENDPIYRLLKSGGLESRREEMLATLSEADLRRVTRFGEKRSYGDGELMFEAGSLGSGEVQSEPRDSCPPDDGHRSALPSAA